MEGDGRRGSDCDWWGWLGAKRRTSRSTIKLKRLSAPRSDGITGITRNERCPDHFQRSYGILVDQRFFSFFSPFKLLFELYNLLLHVNSQNILHMEDVDLLEIDGKWNEKDQLIKSRIRLDQLIEYLVWGQHELTMWRQLSTRRRSPRWKFPYRRFNPRGDFVTTIVDNTVKIDVVGISQFPNTDR